MSIDIDWDTITGGAHGLALAEDIRSFVHDKFQQIELPRFINSVHVHAFEFGDVCPDVEIKDICDPLPDFYDDEDEDDSEGEHGDETDVTGSSVETGHSSVNHRCRSVNASDDSSRQLPMLDSLHRFYGAESSRAGISDHFSGLFPGTGTPSAGIRGGTANFSYFSLPMSGLPGTQTPLAAVASGTTLGASSWNHNTHQLPGPMSIGPPNTLPSGETPGVRRASLTRPSTADTIPSPSMSPPFSPSSSSKAPFQPAEKVSDDPSRDHLTSPPPLRLHQSQPSDLQVVARVKYSGDVRMTLTAEILLDYPMPSFVGIPLKLSITSVTFDGVAVLAYIHRKKRMHFCFLDPEDAETLVGDQIGDMKTDLEGIADSGQRPGNVAKKESKRAVGGLLQEIHVDSEIGRKEGGKQSLKNVGKVENFVLEQVRKIFEEEFVFPSFYTFLV